MIGVESFLQEIKNILVREDKTSECHKNLNARNIKDEKTNEINVNGSMLSDARTDYEKVQILCAACTKAIFSPFAILTVCY